MNRPHRRAKSQPAAYAWVKYGPVDSLTRLVLLCNTLHFSNNSVRMTSRPWSGQTRNRAVRDHDRSCNARKA